MRKLILFIFLFISYVTQAHAGYVYANDTTLSLYDPTGTLIIDTNMEVLELYYDNATGFGSGYMMSSVSQGNGFFGDDLYVDLQLSTFSNGGYILVDMTNIWGAGVDFSSQMLWAPDDLSCTPETCDVTITTLDGDANGVPGIIMPDGPFEGASFGYDVHIYYTPVPAAAWLFCSGLVALFATMRNKNMVKS